MPTHIKVGPFTLNKNQVPSSNFQKLDPSWPKKKEEFHPVLEPDPKPSPRAMGQAVCNNWDCNDLIHGPNKV